MCQNQRTEILHPLTFAWPLFGPYIFRGILWGPPRAPSLYSPCVNKIYIMTFTKKPIKRAYEVLVMGVFLRRRDWGFFLCLFLQKRVMRQGCKNRLASTLPWLVAVSLPPMISMLCSLHWVYQLQPLSDVPQNSESQRLLLHATLGPYTINQHT